MEAKSTFIVLNIYFKGLEKYFLLGFGFSVMKKLIPRMLVVFQQPSELFKLVISKENVKFGAFIGAYASVYRVSKLDNIFRILIIFYTIIFCLSMWFVISYETNYLIQNMLEH